MGGARLQYAVLLGEIAMMGVHGVESNKSSRREKLLWWCLEEVLTSFETAGDYTLDADSRKQAGIVRPSRGGFDGIHAEVESRGGEDHPSHCDMGGR